MALETILREAARFVPTAVQFYTANRKTPAERQQEALLAQQRDIMNQAYDQNSPLMQQQIAIEQANANRGVARTIEEMTRIQRRNMMMGRNPLIDNERADEFFNRYQQTGAQAAAENAPNVARQRIIDMANSRGSMAGTLSGTAQNQRTRMENMGNAITGLTDLAFNPTGGRRSIVDVIADRFGNRNNTPTIQQATPTQNTQGQLTALEEVNRIMGTGGMNAGSMPVAQNWQRGVARPFQGGAR